MLVKVHRDSNLYKIFITFQQRMWDLMYRKKIVLLDKIIKLLDLKIYTVKYKYLRCF